MNETLPVYCYELHYLAKRVRGEILCAVSYCATRLLSPNEDDEKKLFRILHSINGWQLPKARTYTLLLYSMVTLWHFKFWIFSFPDTEPNRTLRHHLGEASRVLPQASNVELHLQTSIQIIPVYCRDFIIWDNAGHTRSLLQFFQGRQSKVDASFQVFGEAMVSIIGASYGRTGTSSFQRAMEILGFGKCYHMRDAINNGHAEQWIELSGSRDPTLIRNLMDKNGYRSTCDMPSSIYWKEQLKAYPDAVVILTVRDAEKWYKSWMETVALMQPDCDECPFGIRIVQGLGFFTMKNFAAMSSRVLTMDTFSGDLSKKNMIKSYNLHVEDVRSSCPPEKLLEFSYTDGWEPLCKFLNVPIPDEPYPNLNDAVAFRRMTTAINIIGWVVFILGCGLPGIWCARSRITEKEKRSSNTAWLQP